MNLAIVVPCFNEEEVLGTTVGHLRELLNQLIAEGLVDSESTITFIDDGSKEKTWSLIENVAKVIVRCMALNCREIAGIRTL